jgi:hypothetical protein
MDHSCPLHILSDGSGMRENCGTGASGGPLVPAHSDNDDKMCVLHNLCMDMGLNLGLCGEMSMT